MNALKATVLTLLPALGVLCGCQTRKPEPEVGEPLLWVPMPLLAGAEDPALRQAVLEVARELEFQDWPDSRVRRTAPDLSTIRTHIMPPAYSSIQEDATYQAVFFRDGLWGQVMWNCSFWPRHRRVGCVEVRLVLCPCCRAAKELILLEAAEHELPVPVTMSLYFRPVEKLGNVAFGRVDEEHGEIRFVRDNVFVHIRTRGALAAQTEELARRLDRAIRKQPWTSYEALLRRRPVVKIAATDEGASPTGRCVCCQISPPSGQKIVCCEAWVNGMRAPSRAGRVALGPRAAPKWVNLTVVTDRLLARSCEGLVQPAE